MSSGSRWWICWIWYRYSHSLCNVWQTLIWTTWRQAEILLVLTFVLLCAIWMYFSFPTICRSECSAHNALGSEPFFMQLSMSSTRYILIWDSLLKNFYQHLSTATLVLSLQKPYRKHMSVCSSPESVNCLFTAILSNEVCCITHTRPDCTVC